jgi:prepilin-type N-terminal cleavage/methylation domain-containing protein
MKLQAISKNKLGFTIIEVLIVIGLLGVIAGMGLTIDLNFYTREIRSSEHITLISLLHRARSNAMNNVSYSDHGIHIENHTYTIFSEMPYDSSNLSNQIINANPNFIITGLNEVIFEKMSGNTENVGTVNIVDVNGNEKIINIQANGLIDW